ncbi:MAG: right-handed parallel beta-helix repeat-containing protein [Planctomycetes bacterium]|nr:right-handed parallel beta-helix repeat-containing protein [Planctomycetota bacterium]
MRTPRLVLLLSSALLSLACPSEAADIRVPQEAATISGALLLAGPGGTVTVSAGTYAENISVPFLGQTIRGKGTAIVDGGGGVGLLVPIGTSGTVVKNLRFQNCLHGLVILGPHTIVSKCRVAGTIGFGIAARGTTNVHIVKCRISDTGSHGVFLDQCNGCLVEKCAIAWPDGNGLHVIGNLNSILGNRVSNAREDGVQLSSAAIPAAGNLVQGNVIRGPLFEGIECGEQAFYCSLLDNTIAGAECDGIDVQHNCVGHALLGNAIRDSGDCGIENDGMFCTLSRNRVDRSHVDGIRVGAGGNANLLSRNTVRNSWGDGFEVLGASNAFVRNTALGSASFDLNSVVPLAANTYVANVFPTTN